MPLYLGDTSGSHALDIASARGLLPTQLNTDEMRKQVAAEIRRNSVFSARTTNARYLEALNLKIQRLLRGGRNNDWAQIRLELKQGLVRLGYTPEKGFPGDESLGIPPAKPGSLRDLSSDARLNLIIDTQRALMRGAARKARGNDRSRAHQFPCWELIRIYDRSVPRGSPGSNSPGWKERWDAAGGPPETDVNGESKLIAPKDHPVWAALGDSSRFKDALDTDHPPFAFKSGMGWREVHWTEAQALGFKRPEMPLKPAPIAARGPVPVIDPPKASASGLSADTIAELKAKLRGIEEKNGVLTLKGILDKGRRPA